jgi:hypothetical protein
LRWSCGANSFDADLVNRSQQILQGSFHGFLNGIAYIRRMGNVSQDAASLAARCKEMAEKASADKRGYWLKMEQFWLSRSVPEHAVAQQPR